MDTNRVVDILAHGIPDEHEGYQVYAAVDGITVCDVADGSAQRGVPMTTDTLTLWFSSGKPITALAIVQLWDRGLLDLDHPASHFLPLFANGKGAVTIRHLLTHQGGFPFADDSLHPGPWDETVEQICAAPAMWAPGESAGYHGTSAWVILAEIVRTVSGLPVEQYMDEQILRPLNMANTMLSVPPDRIAEIRPRLAHIQDNIPKAGDGIGALEFEQYNSDHYLPFISPGNTARGPAHDLGKLMSALATGGGPVLSRTAAEAMVACHRFGLADVVYSMNPDAKHPIWGFSPPWALGLAMNANIDFGSRTSRRTVGSSGAFSSVALADPETGLSCVVITTGLLPLAENARRLGATVDALYAELFG